MTRLVTEERISLPAMRGEDGRLVVVPRGRGRRDGWRDLPPGAVVAALDAAGPDAVVLARGTAADPGAAALPQLGRLLGHRVVRLPDDPDTASWVLAVALHPDFADEGGRRLEALAGGAGGPGLPRLRPGALARWAGCAWRACPRCAGGGPAGGRCVRCGGARLAVAS